MIYHLKSKRFWIVSVLASAAGLGLVSCSSAHDPCEKQVLAFVKSSDQVVSQLGPVSHLQVRRSVTLQDGISVTDQFQPGHRSYDMIVQGTKSTALVSVQTDLKNCAPRITAIDR